MSTKGLGILLETKTSTPSEDTIQAITAASPAVVTPATIVSFNDGDWVLITGTGLKELDDMIWEVANKTGTGFELKCSDTSTAGTSATGKATPLAASGASAVLVPWCISSFSRDTPAAETISVGNFCDPSAQVSGDAQAGSISFNGPLDPCDKSFQELNAAIADGKERWAIVKFPQNNGELVMKVELNSVSESMELNSAITFTGGGILKTSPTYRTCSCP
jgi:hypothetical protein